MSALPTRVLPVATLRQYVTDVTGLMPQAAGDQGVRKMHLLITVINGEVTEVAPRADGDRTWGIPLPTESVE